MFCYFRILLNQIRNLSETYSINESFHKIVIPFSESFELLRCDNRDQNIHRFYEQ